MPPACADHRQQHQLLGHEFQPLKNNRRRLKLSVDLSDEVMNGQKEQHQNESNVEMLDHGEGEVDDYSFDEFRMYEFKVRRCLRSRSHEWTDCPFAHPGEKARRRDPRRYHYSGTPCPDYRRTGGDCPRGDACEYAHGVFEIWLHPARYRTMPCKDGRRCRRKVCFFAHTPAQLRVVHPTSTLPPTSCYSPTSILMGLSAMTPPLSPSLSPPARSSPGRESDGGILKSLEYSGMYTELVSSLEAMQVNQAAAAAAAASSVDQSNGDGAGPDLGWVEELLE